MVEAKNSRLCPEHSARQLPNSNCMNLSLEPRRQECLKTFENPGTCMSSEHLALPGYLMPPMSSLRTEQIQNNEGSGVGLLRFSPSHFLPILPTLKTSFKEPMLSLGVGGFSLQNLTNGPSQKGFLIFDQSGNQIRVMYSPVGSSVHIPPSFMGNSYRYGSNEEEQINYKNHVSAEESEMHEDTDEINALLYSDDDYYCSSDDEVTSTDHSPIQVKENDERQEQVQKITEEVASSDAPRKRQRLLDGGYIKSAVMDTVSSLKVDGSHECGIDTESSYAIGKTEGNGVDSELGDMPLRKDKIRETLKVLERIIPGAKGRGPMLVIDESINYLKSLKHKARALGMSY